MNVKKYFIIFLFFFPSFLWIKKIYAWDKTAHRTIAYITQYFLSDETAEELKKILDPFSIEYLASLPDDLKKKNQSFYWVESEEAYPLKRKNIYWYKTKSWHFINNPFKSYKNSQEENVNKNAYNVIKESLLILKSEKIKKEEKKNAIVWLMHLIADIHQPFRLFNTKDFNKDSLKIKWHEKDLSLFDLWDSFLILQFKLSYEELANFLLMEYENDKIFYHNKSLIKNKDEILDQIHKWLLENQEIKEKIISKYKNLSSVDEYIVENLEILKKQLILSGIRISEVLNLIYQKNKDFDEEDEEDESEEF